MPSNATSVATPHQAFPGADTTKNSDARAWKRGLGGGWQDSVAEVVKDGGEGEAVGHVSCRYLSAHAVERDPFDPFGLRRIGGISDMHRRIRHK